MTAYVTAIVLMYSILFGCAHADDAPTDYPTTAGAAKAFPATSQSLPTVGWAPDGPPAPLPLPTPEAERARTIASRATRCPYALAELTLMDIVYIGCSGGAMVAVDGHQRVIASTTVGIYRIDSIKAAGDDAIVDQQPLGQGENNYMVGQHLYVVVGPITYEYDVRDLTVGPRRLSTTRKSG